MKKFIITTFKVLALILLVIVLIGMANALWSKYSKYWWVPEQPFHGVSVGMTISDVHFLKGEPTLCSEEKDVCVWAENDYDADDKLIVRFDGEKAFLIAKSKRPYGYSPPFSSVEEMINILGEEDILSVSKDMLERRYTYLKWGATFGFEINNLSSAMIGEVEWRKTPDISEYKVKGRVICPSEDCPFDSEGKVKPEYVDKSYEDFL